MYIFMYVCMIWKYGSDGLIGMKRVKSGCTFSRFFKVGEMNASSIAEWGGLWYKRSRNVEESPVKQTLSEITYVVPCFWEARIQVSSGPLVYFSLTAFYLNFFIEGSARLECLVCDVKKSIHIYLYLCLYLYK